MRNSLTGKALRRVLQDNSGATAIEYALIAAGISIAILAGDRNSRQHGDRLLRQLGRAVLNSPPRCRGLPFCV